MYNSKSNREAQPGKQLPNLPQDGNIQMNYADENSEDVEGV